MRNWRTKAASWDKKFDKIKKEIDGASVDELKGYVNDASVIRVWSSLSGGVVKDQEIRSWLIETIAGLGEKGVYNYAP